MSVLDAAPSILSGIESGHPRRLLETSKAKKEFGFEAKTDFREGLRKTIDWYKSQL